MCPSAKQLVSAAVARFTPQWQPHKPLVLGGIAGAVMFGGLVCLCLVGCDKASGRLEWGPGGTAERAEPQTLDISPAVTAWIQHPADEDVVTAGELLEISGRMVLKPESGRGYVFAADEYGFHLQYPALWIDDRTGRFTHRNIRLATAGSWELHVVWADPQAARELEARATRGDWSSLANLPHGVQIVRSIRVVAR